MSNTKVFKRYAMKDGRSGDLVLVGYIGLNPAHIVHQVPFSHKNSVTGEVVSGFFVTTILGDCFYVEAEAYL